MTYVQLTIAIIQFIMQFLRYMDKAQKPTDKSVAAKTKKFLDFHVALSEAEQGKGEKLEDMFTVMRPKSD